VLVRIGVLLPAAMAGLEWVAVAMAASSLARSWLTWRCLHRLHGLAFTALLLAIWQSALLAGLCAIPALAALLLLQGAAWQLLGGGAAALLAWAAGVVLLRHPLADELARLAARLRLREAKENL
jgi:hypothetical protein